MGHARQLQSRPGRAVHGTTTCRGCRNSNADSFISTGPLPHTSPLASPRPLCTSQALLIAQLSCTNSTSLFLASFEGSCLYVGESSSFANLALSGPLRLKEYSVLLIRTKMIPGAMLAASSWCLVGAATLPRLLRSSSTAS